MKKVKLFRLSHSVIDLKVMITLLTARLPVTVSSVQTWFYIILCKESFAGKHTYSNLQADIS